MQFAILDEQGSRVGELTMSLQEASDANRLNQRFNHWGGFNCFLRQLPITDVYPFAELCDLEVHYDKQRQGHGRRALSAFNALAQSRGAKWGFLRIATQGEDYETGVRWRHDFYQSEGWEDFQPLASGEYFLHCMFRRFGESSLPTREVETVLQELDEMEEFLRVMRTARIRGAAE
jgi:hypothetical protein